MTFRVALGFDFGTKRLGVAVASAVTKIATPLETVAMQEGVPANWQTILTLIKRWGPDVLVVGLPLNMDGSEQWITQRAREFSATLHEQTGLPVELIDERLSTLEVRQRVFESGGYKALKKANIDSLAATVILDQWMNQRKST